MANLNGDTLISQKISEVQDIEHKLIPYSPQRNWKFRTPSIISWCLILPKECWKFRMPSITSLQHLILPREYRKFGTTSISLHLILPSRVQQNVHHVQMFVKDRSWLHTTDCVSCLKIENRLLLCMCNGMCIVLKSTSDYTQQNVRRAYQDCTQQNVRRVRTLRWKISDFTQHQNVRRAQ